ncbi:hypothetical protein Rhopal_007243-T1 [Rhodotorula paludigena]|uniref:XRRM domain-containing protein n=1 Tax=Rhodotorula paludigena TaxID=86838 RepID=A0AAV5GW21_9BASI|nr:hypothetical protein Rhopal_007243-T1 [Rhodotorula paludigena]
MATPDSLFSAPQTPATEAPSPPGSAPPPPSTAAPPAFVPRAVKRRPAPARPTAAALLAAQSSTSQQQAPPATTSTSSTPSDVKPSTPAATAQTAPKLSAAERDRLETLLCTIETSLSDYGLSVHRLAGGDSRKTGLLEQYKAGREWLHISQILNLPPVRALTGTLADVQKALRLRDSPIVAVDEAGYQLGRKQLPDVQRLEALDPADWDDAVVYLENVPFTPALGDTSLTLFLASALASTPQRILLPPAFDRNDPLALDPAPDGANTDDQSSQAAAFRAAQDEGKKRAKGLPKGGGAFKGFAFVVLPSKEEAERVLSEWSWEREGDESAENDDEGDEGDEAEEDAEMADASTGAEGKGKGKAKKDKPSSEGELHALRYPPAQRDQPPHLAKSAAPAPRDPPSSSTKRHNKRAASPSSPVPEGGADPDASFASSTGRSAGQSTSKRPKRASSPSTALQSRLRAIRTPSPGLDLASDAALDVQGAYPEKCVLWVRNVHEKSNRTTLKALFGALLDSLQEGSSKGVEFVDYEKGLDTCYLRFSAPSLASLVQSHLLSAPSLHLAPTALSPVALLSPSSRTAAESDARRPLAVSLLEGEQERRYWANVPEATRRAARKAAGGKVGLLKEPGTESSGAAGGRGAGGRGKGKRKNEANGGSSAVATSATAEASEPQDAAVGEEQPRKRKKPSRM